MQLTALLLAISACGGGAIGPIDGAEAADADGDGYPSDEDCDDADAGINPAAAEVCNEADDDCDGAIDAADATSEVPVWYQDADGDGYGDPGASERSCEAPPGYDLDPGDCDDADPKVHPLAETCTCEDGADNDSDGLLDCEDGDCAADAACVEDDCADGFDEENDGLADCDDDDCWGTRDCVDVRAWVNAGRFEGGRSVRYTSSFWIDTDRRIWKTHAWVRAFSVQGSVARRSPHLGLSTTCTWTLSSADWHEGRISWIEELGDSGSTLSLVAVARAGPATSPGCPADLSLSPYLPLYVGAGEALDWGEAGSIAHHPLIDSWSGPLWYVAGSWRSSRIASASYDPGGSDDYIFWRSTYEDAWSGALTRGESYYRGAGSIGP